jgi:P4 family phage/plasmid primase-like protien
MYKNHISKDDKLVNEAIIKMAETLRKNDLSFYTGYLVELSNINVGEKPKKYLARNKTIYLEKGTEKTGICHSKVGINDWDNSKINKDDNCIVLITGERSKNIVLIDWDLQKWNKEAQCFEINNSVMELYNETKNKIWSDNDITTYNESTGNCGMHWLFKYDPKKIGGIIKEHNGFKINNVSCGDIKGNGGLCYMAPTTYKSIDDEDKKYETEIEFDYNTIEEIPTFLIEYLGLKIEYFDQIKNTDIKPRTKTKKNKSNSIDSNLPKLTKLDTEEDFIIGYLNCINADDYDNWLKVSFILGIYPQYHNLYHQWAKQSNKYVFEECNKLLEKSNGELTLKSLCYMAKKTDKYNEVFGAIIEEKELITMIENFNEKNVTEYYYKHTKNEIYFDVNYNWFIINENCIWENEKEFNLERKKQFMNFIINKLTNYNQYIVTKRKQTLDDDDKQKIGCKNFKDIQKYIINLGKTNFIKSCIEMFKTYFYNKTITDILVSQTYNRYKFAFNNCLYDLKTKKFRNITPEDYILVTTKYNYNKNPKKIEEVKRILKDIVGDDETDNKYCSDYTMLLNKLSKCLIGLNLDRRFNIISGIGCNGKSLLFESFIKPALGSYYASISSGYFTKADQHSNSATPEIADKQYTRFLGLSEPEACEYFQSSKIKKISGMDEIQTRQLYSQGKSWVPQFTAFCLCNDIPNLNTIDRATLNRIDILEFKNQFVNNPDPNNKYQKQKNDNLPTIISDDTEYRDSFITILIENYEKMNRHIISKAVELKKEDYIKENNPILPFINDMIVISNGKNVKSSELYNEYCKYCSDKNINKVANNKFSSLMKFNNFTNRITKKCTEWLNIEIRDLLELNDE